MGFDSFFKGIENGQKSQIDRLSKWVAVESVSADPSRRNECFKMIKMAKEDFESLGAKMEIIENPCKTEITPDGLELPLPPILLGTYPAVPDANKKTILLYGHIDVQPACKSDGWDTEPFVLTEKDGKLYGRGSTDDKGPVLGWLVALEEMKKQNIPLPVNVKFCFEAMEESGSIGLEDLIFKSDHKSFFSENVDGTCISDNYWLGKNKPCLTFGLRGCIGFSITARGAKKDLHSGVFGGSVEEAMNVLVKIMSQLVDLDGKILIPGILDQVEPVTQKELDMYKDIDFCPETYKNDIGCNDLIHKNNKAEILMSRWRNPSLALHGIEGAFSEPGFKTVIPAKVVGKFSIRIVPNMTAERTIEITKKYVNDLVKKLNPTCDVSIENHEPGPAWIADTNNFLFKAAREATIKSYGIDPDFTREGCSIPVTMAFENASGNPVLLLPMGACDDGAHSQNEKINISNFIQGTKQLGAFLLSLK